MIRRIINTRNDNIYHESQEMITHIKAQEISRNQAQEIQKTQERGLSLDGGMKHSYAYHGREAIPGKLSYTDWAEAPQIGPKTWVASPTDFEGDIASC